MSIMLHWQFCYSKTMDSLLRFFVFQSAIVGMITSLKIINIVKFIKFGRSLPALKLEFQIFQGITIFCGEFFVLNDQ